MRIIMTVLGATGLVAALMFGACDKGTPTPAATEQGLQQAADPGQGEAAEAPKVKAAAASVASEAGGAVDHAGEADCPFHGDEGEADHEGCSCGKVDGGHEGCAHAQAAGDDAAAEDAAARHFGAPFTLTQATPLAKALEAHGDGSADVLQVSGSIHKVCQKKGCWMVVKDGDAEARVVMKGYAFTVPTDSQGKQTVIEGTLKVKTFTEAQAKHLAIDAGEDPSKVTGGQKEFLLTATGISIKG